VTTLEILLIIVAILLLTGGGFGYRRRGRCA
jgi:LPXTG-motif cell wall-anchored protein